MLRGKKLGILLSVPPTHANFARGLSLAETALSEGVDVYLYCIDEAVPGVDESKLQLLRERGLKLYACAYSAQHRGLPLTGNAIFSGLTVVRDLIVGTDRFLSFN
jgi:predicted peroxiredoxin